MAEEAAADAHYRIVSTALDQAFYRAAYPELDRPGLDPVRHYIERGWREGRDPAPWFSVRRYLAQYRDIRELGQEPFEHYLRHGGREGRPVFPSEHAEAFSHRAAWRFEVGRPPPPPAAPEPPPPFSEEERRIVAPAFDAGFYLETNPDLAGLDLDLLEHFLAHGWREGRDPCPQFSLGDYLQENPDIVRAGINPFFHWLAAGRAEGRSPRNALGFRHRILAALEPLEVRVARAAQAARAAPSTPAAALQAAIAGSRTGLQDLHVTFSHDDYAANLGGVQLCLQYEAARIAELGRDHLHICPATPWPVLRRGEPGLLSVLLNGRQVGDFSAATICESLAAAPPTRSGRRSFAIHNLLGHDVGEVLGVLEAAGLEAGFFWLHDFTSLCAGYQLLRNDVQDCAAPPPDSAACGICVYGAARGPQVAEHERLFRRLKLTVVSPSQVTLDFWKARTRCRGAGERVHPHVRLERRASAPAPAPGPLRLAFLGMPSAHKGWPIFAELATDFADDSRYRFLHLGARRDPRCPAEFHPVSVSLQDPRAMQRAIETLEVDVAVIWSIFRETFCLAAYEAVAAGAAIVTGPDSANVAALVDGGLPGRVLADEAALRRALETGELVGLSRAVRRPWLHELRYSGMTADLLEAGVAA